MKKIIVGSVVLIIAIGVACSVAKKNELDSDAKVFLNDFRDKLNGADEDILKLFVSTQDKEEILKGISILQNKDTAYAKVKIIIDQAKSSRADSWLIVQVPVELKSKKAESPLNITISLKLFKLEGKVYAASIDAEELYRKYSEVKSEIENAEAMARGLAELKIYYDKAKELQKDYDSVVWFVNHKDVTYYYAINGSFNFDSLKKDVKQEYKMGLLDETGRVIVPVEFDLIGNPSISLKEAIEVKRNGKIGYYTLEGKEIVPVVYDWLIPFKENEALALVKKDTLYGWIDTNFTYHDNFPSPKAEQAIREFTYLTDNTFSFGGQYMDLISIVYPVSNDIRNDSEHSYVQYSPNAVIIPPAYFVKCGLFSTISDDFVHTDSLHGYQYGTDFIETKSKKPVSISETISAFVTDFKSRFIGGRVEFYTNHKIVLIDKRANVLTSTEFYGNEFRKVTDILFESKLNEVVEGGSGYKEFDFPYYTYFSLVDNKFTPLRSNRSFQASQFVKLDSSYFVGIFRVWDYQAKKEAYVNYVSKETLGTMRDEILASYGFVFPDQARNERYLHVVRDLPIVSSYDEVYSKASEIDKYNLDFLNKLIGSTPGGKSI